MARGTKTSKKSKRKTSKSVKTRIRGKGDRAKHAFMCFSKEKRKDVLVEAGLKDGPENFGAASKALSAAWSKLNSSERKPFEAQAMIDRCRKEIQDLRGAKLKEPKGLSKAASSVKTAVQTLSHLSDTSLANVLIEALESLDGRLGNAGRATLSQSFRGGARAPEVLAACVQLEDQLGGRLVALLRKWSSVPASQARPNRRREVTTTTTGTEVKDRPKMKVPRDVDGLDDSMRSKFVGILMRTVSQTDKACFDACSKIERALFQKCGKDPKEYRRRARSLSSNLGSSDGQLLRQVLSGALPAERLVALEGEELASEEVKEARKEERERYFRSEVHLKVAPPKRKRDLYHMAEDLPREERPAKTPKTPKTPKTSSAENEDAQLARALAAADAESLSSSSDSESDSGSESDSESSEESVWETDFGLLPFVTDETGTGAKTATSSSSAAASSSSSVPPAPRPAATVDALATLRGMGFEELVASASLQAAGGNLEKAILMLT